MFGVTISALNSLVVSAVVDALTFVAGVRTGKNHADRPVPRAIYQACLSTSPKFGTPSAKALR